MTHPLAPILTSDPRAIANAGVDCLVIGSGTSGVTAAIELANHGLRVAILEAGPLLLTEHVGSGPFANREDIVPGIHDVVRYGTLWTTSDQEQAARAGSVETNNNAWSLVGGRTVFWGGCTPRFRDEDFATWPYGADEVRPWYERAEQLIGASGVGSNDRPPLVSHAAQDRLLARLGVAGIQATQVPLGVDTAAVRDGRMSLGFNSSVSRLLRHPKFGRIENGAAPVVGRRHRGRSFGHPIRPGACRDRARPHQRRDVRHPSAPRDPCRQLHPVGAPGDGLGARPR